MGRPGVRLALGLVFVALLAASPLLIRAVWDTSDEYAVIVGESAVVWGAVMIGAVWMLNSTEPGSAPPGPDRDDESTPAGDRSSLDHEAVSAAADHLRT